MARIKPHCYNKAAVKAPRSAGISTRGQDSNGKSRSKVSTSVGNSYFSRSKPSWQLNVDGFFPKSAEPVELKEPKKRVNKPEETAVAGGEIVESSCRVEESDSESAGPSKSANVVDNEMAGPSKGAEKVDIENAGSSTRFDEMDICPVKFVFKGDFINPNPLSGEDYFLFDDVTYVMIDEEELLEY